MNIRYRVTLTPDERENLREWLSQGKLAHRRARRAQVLLGADAGLSEETIATAVGVGTATVYRIKRRFVEEGLAQALEEKPRPGAPRKLSLEQEALLVATACSEPPSGRSRWTLELLADKLVCLTEHESLGKETVRRRLHEKEVKPWLHKMWCIPKVDAEFVARMEDILALYTEPADETHPVVCLDESPTQLIGEVRDPSPVQPGTPARSDAEYQRNGTANLFVWVDAHHPHRHVEVTEHRTAIDFAHVVRDLVDEHYPKAEKIRVVVDNLSTHTPAALYQAFDAPEARRLARRLEFHYTPKHASWLNMVEIEIGVLKKQCLARRIPDRTMLRREVSAWLEERNETGARINWLFDVDRARQKLGRSYPKVEAKDSTDASEQAAA